MALLCRRVLILIFLSLVSASAFANTILSPKDPLQFQQANFVHNDAFEIPTFKPAEIIDLPHTWDTPQGQSGWYRFTFEVQDMEPKTYAVYLPSLNMNAEIFLNGVSIGSGGQMTTPVSRYWHKPMIQTFSSKLFVQDENTINIHVIASSPGIFGHLGKVSVGLQSQLAPEYAWQFFEEDTLYVISMALGFLIGTVMLYLWYLRRRDESLWFALGCIAWALSCFNITVVNIPVSTKAWEITMLWIIGWTPVFLSMFLHRFMMIKQRTLEQLMFSIGILFYPLLWLVPDTSIYFTTYFWHGAAIAMALHAIYLLVRRKNELIHEQPFSIQSLIVVMVLVVIFGIHDFMVMLEILPANSHAWLGFAVPMLLLGILVLLIRRFVDAAAGLEIANATLEQKVSAAERRINENYQVIAGLEMARALDQERNRIFGDLHDDLGAKLLSLVYKSETDDQKHLAKDAMNGLREIVRRNVDDVHDYSMTITVLQWRLECKQRLDDKGVMLDWHQCHLEKVASMPSRATPQLTSLLREAISNALKYGDDKHITVRLQYRNKHLLMSVRNQGAAWLEKSSASSGRNSMKNRVDSLNGNIRWRAGKKGGCHVSWCIPLEVNEHG
ncbi:MAG: hypothetical protein Q9M20_01610 [Mariprofundaceae bacterium]|nr:hypothetical protein [Mariprofundaceae bacterium]